MLITARVIIEFIRSRNLIKIDGFVVNTWKDIHVQPHVKLAMRLNVFCLICAVLVQLVCLCIPTLRGLPAISSIDKPLRSPTAPHHNTADTDNKGSEDDGTALPLSPVEEPEVQATAVEFMKELYAQMSYVTGSLENNPMSVWCLVDHDAAWKGYRNDDSSSEDKCSAFTRFVFGIEDLVFDFQEKKELPLKEGTLRTYLSVTPKLLGESEVVPVQISAKARLLQRNGEGGPGHGTSVAVGELQLDIDSSSSGWIELDVAEGLRTLWPPKLSDNRLELNVSITVDCKEHDQVPAHFINPASVPLSETERRQQAHKLQPMLVLRLEDAELKDKMTAKMEDHKMDRRGANHSTQAHPSTRSRCALQNMTIDFGSIDLSDVFLFPRSYNAKKCEGDCSYYTIRDMDSSSTTFHAVLAAHSFAKYGQKHLHKEPCCTPIEYRGLSLVVQRSDGSVCILPYDNMIVTKCGCM